MGAVAREQPLQEDNRCLTLRTWHKRARDGSLRSECDRTEEEDNEEWRGEQRHASRRGKDDDKIVVRNF